MRKSNLLKLMLVVSLLAGLVWAVAGGSYQITPILGSDAGIGNYIVEDIQICEDGQSAIMVGIANSDDAHIYKYDLGSDTVVAACDVGILYGPRGTSGLAINLSCTKAYVPNYPSDTLSVIDLTQLGSPDEMPDCVSLAEINVSPKATEAAITYPDDAYVLVTDSFTDTATVIDTASNTIKCEVEVGFGPNQAAALGRQAFYVANRYSDDVAVLDPNTCELHVGQGFIAGLDRVPQSIAITPDGQWAYVADFVADMVDVINIPAKAVVAKIAVGDSPRYIVSSWDGLFIYVANTIDKTISVISTASKSVVDTIEVIGANEPAPIGAIAVTKDNRYLYVFWTGGKSGTPADFVIFKIDVGQLYG